MKVLISVLSCQRDRALGCHDITRREWGDRLADITDVRFFIGGAQPDNLKPDEVWLDVPDDYEHLPLKTRGIAHWMLEREYDYVIKCDCDTRIFEKEFRRFDYGADYSGVFYAEQHYAAGGFYVLSRKAAKIIADDPEMGKPGAEDVKVGQALQDGRIRMRHLDADVPYVDNKGSGEGAAHGMPPVHIMVQLCRQGCLIGTPRRMNINGAQALIARGCAYEVKEGA